MRAWALALETLADAFAAESTPNVAAESNNPAEDVASSQQMGEKPKRAKPKKGEQSDGSKVWAAYRESYLRRYPGREPARNATTNAQCNTLIQRLGLEAAIKLAGFYPTVGEAFYLKQFHPIGLAVKDYHALSMQMQGGKVVTMRSARQQETLEQSAQGTMEFFKDRVVRNDRDSEPLWDEEDANGARDATVEDRG